MGGVAGVESPSAHNWSKFGDGWPRFGPSWSNPAAELLRGGGVQVEAAPAHLLKPQAGQDRARHVAAPHGETIDASAAGDVLACGDQGAIDTATPELRADGAALKDRRCRREYAHSRRAGRLAFDGRKKEMA